MLTQELQEVLEPNIAVGLDEGADPLAEDGIRHRYDRDIGQPGQRYDEVLDLFGRDVLAAPDDALLQAPRETQEAVGVHAADVPGAAPSVRRERLDIVAGVDVPDDELGRDADHLTFGEYRQVSELGD